MTEKSATASDIDSFFKKISNKLEQVDDLMENLDGQEFKVDPNLIKQETTRIFKRIESAQWDMDNPELKKARETVIQKVKNILNK